MYRNQRRPPTLCTYAYTHMGRLDFEHKEATHRPFRRIEGVTH